MTLRISFNQTTSPKVRDDNGYGYAAKMCQRSLENLGHEITWQDSTADIEINFIQPDKWVWTGPYRIGYLPWESTEFHPGWVEKMNDCDEVWTPSPVIAQWMVDAGVTKDVKIYQHGVEALWSPVRRASDGPFRMLHHGAEALRKDSASAINAFDRVFPASKFTGEQAQLWLKCQLNISSAAFHDSSDGRTKVRNGRMPLDDLIALYHQSDLFVYPSWGEGFGLGPLQAMATGMPVLITDGWAPYAHLLGEQNVIKSSMADSPWPTPHPGKMFRPDFDDLMDKLRWHYDNRQTEAEVAYSLVDVVASEYDWDALTEQAFAHLNR